MENYNEAFFRAKTNKRASITWVLLLIVACIYYGIKVGTGTLTPGYYAAFAIVGWAVYIVGQALLFIKGMDFKPYKWIVGLGYLAFYSVIAWTALDQISYVFILPLISILILYKDPKFIRTMMWITLFVLISSNAYKGLAKGMMDYMASPECALQLVIVIGCYVCTNMAIKHLVESDGALTQSIKSNLERVVRTVEQVKDASNAVVDGVTVVRELADENRTGANDVMKDMQNLDANNGVLNEKTLSSMEMTKVIDTQVKGVADLMEQVVDLIGASVEHANVSAGELVEVVETTNKMADLSKQVEQILEDFKKEFENVKVVTWEGSFNYSAINNFGVKYTNGEYLLFLNNDTEMISEHALEEMLGCCMREEVGAVGAKLLYEDDTVQHAGVVVGFGGYAGHVNTGIGRDDYGYMVRAMINCNYSAVTAACMLTKKELFLQVGGFDEQFVVACNDVDYCLQLRSLDKLIVYNAFAEWYHYESKSRGYEDTPEKLARFENEVKKFQKKWPEILEKGDPFYNPNFPVTQAPFTLG